MVLLRIPDVCQPLFHYTLDVIFKEFLGLTFKVESHNGDVIEMTMHGSDVKLTLCADFFHQANRFWLKEESMPKEELSAWNPSDDGLEVDLIKQSIPVIFGAKGLLKNESHWHINIDILGSVFFMISRYEELVVSGRDNHDRFPASAAVAHQQGFLDRPIVDEYVEILWACIKHLWPSLARKKRHAQTLITCDTDWPYDPALVSWKLMLRRTASLVIKQRKLIQPMTVAMKFLANKLEFKPVDEYRQAINWIMDVNEKAGNKVAFYFITYKTSVLDTDEDFDSLQIRSIFREIAGRGHEIGIHPGYETFNQPINFSNTVAKLKQIMDEEGIRQDTIGGRQHFLRWDTAQTPHLWEEFGLNYDSSLMFADVVGFRCGTSHEYPMFDLLNRKPFKLKQRPLIAMESSIISQRYEGLGYSEESLQRFKLLKERAVKYGGCFTLLWHNSHFENVEDFEFYKQLIIDLRT